MWNVYKGLQNLKQLWNPYDTDYHPAIKRIAKVFTCKYRTLSKRRYMRKAWCRTMYSAYHFCRTGKQVQL